MDKDDQFYLDFFKTISNFETYEFKNDNDRGIQLVYFKSGGIFSIFCSFIEYPTELEQAKEIYRILMKLTIPAKFEREYNEDNDVVSFGGDGVNPKSQITVVMPKRCIFKDFGLDNIRINMYEAECILLFFYIDLEVISPSKSKDGMIYIGSHKDFEICEFSINSFWYPEDEIKIYDGNRYVEGKNGIWPNEEEEK